MKCMLEGLNAKVFAKAVQTLARIGDDYYLEALPDGLHLRTINSTQTGYIRVIFFRDFFAEFEQDDVSGANPEYKNRCKVSVKALTSVMKNMKMVKQCRIFMDAAKYKLIIKLQCKQKIDITHNVAVLDQETLQADDYVSKTILNQISAKHHIFSEIVKGFQSNIEELTFRIIADEVTVQNFTSNSNMDHRFMRSQMKLKPSEFVNYNVTQPTTISFCLRELRAILAFADALNVDMEMKFETTGKKNSAGSNGTEYSETIATRSTDSAPSTPEDNINVVIRVRPLSHKERRSHDPMVVQFPGNGQILCDGISSATPAGGTQKPKLFGYNVVFEPGASQDDVLQYSGIKRIIEMAVEGFSCTAFCYGQTGSGKTHTLTGPPDLFIGKPNPSDDRHGLIFKSFFYLFQLLQERKDTHFVMKASFLEIYNEKVIDLLNPGSARKPLAVRWSKKSRGFFVENLFTVDCEELDDLLAVLEEGMRNRSVGSHSMNDHSSRSHTILCVHITSEQQAENGVFISKQGKINFVDLAGSEMTKKTNSEGKTLEEANNINKSLMVLGYCIASLSDSKKRSGHIPYRDSQLTKLLADSLAGNGVTLMIACVSPARSNISETLNTLRYAARAKKIRTKPIIVMDPREALILSLKREINALQLENDHLKSALHLHTDMLSDSVEINGHVERKEIPAAPKVDLDRMTELEIAEIVELVKLYVKENEALRNENTELFNTRDMILRDQEIVCRENERLLKKLEDVNSVCCRSPIIPARPTFSADMLQGGGSVLDGDSNIWTNPMSVSTDNISMIHKNDNLDGRLSSNENRIPESIQKELDRRRIGTSIQDIASSLRRNNSWDNEQKRRGTPSNRTRQSPKLIDSQRKPSIVQQSSHSPPPRSSSSIESILSPMFQAAGKYTSLQKSKSNNDLRKNREIFGSMISIYEDEHNLL